LRTTTLQKCAAVQRRHSRLESNTEEEAGPTQTHIRIPRPHLLGSAPTRTSELPGFAIKCRVHGVACRVSGPFWQRAPRPGPGGRCSRRCRACTRAARQCSSPATPGHASKIKTRLDKNVKRFRGGLVFKAHRRVYHSTLGLRVIKQKRSCPACTRCSSPALQGFLDHQKQRPPRTIQ